ncbi:NAD(P)/FAD-dependent oxidoreductase [Thalassobacillus sp. B23F22_16]|uniref:NAD(P)/FAD-dependent oxidoreductase n=1 Tax=Thalassobacillus sp. B23F22_16 TaxID=3459513 RepID=UPI00373EE22F
MKQDECFDITIIGGGPSGLFTAFYGGLRQMKVKIIESMPQLGGQLSALYPEKYIYDVAGFPKIRAQELVDNLTEQAMQFEPTISLGESVQSVERLEDNSFLLTTNTGEKHYTKTIIVTAGAGAFQPRLLKLQNARQYENKNLFYFVKDLNRFSGQRVVVCGGGDSAVDWANMLEPIAKEVTLIHRRDKFRAHEHSVDHLMNSKAKVRTPYVVKDVTGNENKINKLIIENVKDQGLDEIDVDALLVNYGYVSSLGPIKDWNLTIEKNSIVVNSKMETSEQGIYAVGDIATYEGKIKLIATGFGEAPVAVSNAKTYIDPNARMQPLHSTSVMGDKEKKSALVKA